MDFIVADSLSGAGATCNEDAFGYQVSGDVLDVWIIDGATSVADQEFLNLEISDPAWFARAVNDYFQNYRSNAAPPEIIRAAVSAVSATYFEKTTHLEVPLYARPLAALVWLRFEGGAVTLWSMGDSRFLIQQGDQVPFLFPHILRGDVSPLPPDSKPEPLRSRTGVLMAHALHERTQRERKHSEPQMARLGFHADSILYAEIHRMEMNGPFDILGVSDGFYRLVDEYYLHDDESLMRVAKKEGLAFLYKQLRAYEREQDMAHAIKKSDDATAVLVCVG